MSRDCHDAVVSKELEIISVELVEKAEALEASFSMPSSSGATDDPPSADVISISDDDKT